MKNDIFKIVINSNADVCVCESAIQLQNAVSLVLGKKYEIVSSRQDNGARKIILSLFSDDDNLLKNFKTDYDALLNSDGFAVRKFNQDIYILAHTSSGIFYGVHDFMEKNADIVFNRGAKETSIDYLPCESLQFSVCNYRERPAFEIRGYQTCGEGFTGLDHIDDDTCLYLARNKINSISGYYHENWRKYGLNSFMLGFDGRNAAAPYIETHPEYFMHDAQGKPRKIYTNYYNKDVPKIMAKQWYEYKKQNPSAIFGYVFPDDPYFCMIENGERLDKKPFVTDGGLTVYPNQENYKSAVFFNFMNRLADEMLKLDKDAKIATHAYIYSEAAPPFKINDAIIVDIAPITVNERYSIIDEIHPDNAKIKRNIESWTKVCKNVCMYAYWNSFQGAMYSRNNLFEVQENLKWLKSIGVTGLDVEGCMDCSEKQTYSARQLNQRKWHDMNEALVTVLLKLMWNPYLDVWKEIERIVKIVYKESAPYMFEYFKLLRRGWDKTDAVVWYSTGGSVYTLDFIINAGVRNQVLDALENARVKAKTASVKSRVENIYQTVKEQITIYDDFVKEKGYILRVNLNQEQILSDKAMDLENNPDSIWNKAIPMKVFRNYQNMQYFSKDAKFDCRMIADETALYVGYKIYDDRIIGAEWRGDNYVAILDDVKEKELEANAELYIGGNSFNKTTYYGYMSGFSGNLGKNLWYKNEGSPVSQPVPQGMKDVKFVKLSDNPKERYVFHVQVLPYSALGVEKDDFRPYGSVVYLTYRYGRAGWMGYGLWCKQSLSEFEFIDMEVQDEEKRENALK